MLGDYKSFSGKINTYALRAQAMPRHYAIKVLEETHQHWKSLHLIKKKHTIGESSHQVDSRKVDPNVITSPKMQALSTSSPRVAAIKLPHSVLSQQGGVSELTGMEQPLDKLMMGK